MITLTKSVDMYMRRWTGSALVQNKQNPLTKPIMTYVWLNKLKLNVSEI